MRGRDCATRVRGTHTRADFPEPSTRVPRPVRVRRRRRRRRSCRSRRRPEPRVSDFDPPVARRARRSSPRALAEDLGLLGDLTVALVPADAPRRGDVVARADGVLAGTALRDRGVRAGRPDGRGHWLRRRRRRGRRRARSSARCRARCGRSSPASAPRSTSCATCSGVAIAHPPLRATAAGDGARSCDTRKTLPGSAGAREGGGARRRRRQPPRLAVATCVLIKDNHLAGLGDHRGGRTRRARAGRAAPSRSSATRSSRWQEAIAAGADSCCSTT